MPRVPPELSNHSALARYPFLPQARSHMRTIFDENGIDIDAILEQGWLEEARSLGRLRLVESILHKSEAEPMATVDLANEASRLFSLAAYQYAFLVVCASHDERLISRWAEGESSLADKNIGLDETFFEDVVMTYISSLKREIRNGRQVYSVPLSDFLELCPRISGSYWRLVNRPVIGGWVTLDPASGETSAQRVARLVKERIREDLISRSRESMMKISEELADRLGEEVTRIVDLFGSQIRSEVPISAATREDWPPCFSSSIEELASGVNVNHVGRVFVAAMGKSMGIPVEMTCSFFEGAPDYDPQTTSYQVGHVYEREYTPHGCAALKAAARCPVGPGDDRLCDQEWLTHPLKYMRAKQRSRSKIGPVTT